MRKYLFIFKSEIMTDLTYIADLLANFFGYFIHIFIFLYLWKYIYSDPNELINGYTMVQMVWYVIVTEYIWSIASARSLCKNISNEVKSGEIIYKVNKPYSYIGYLISSKMGSSLIKGVVYSLLALLLGFLLLGSFPSLNLLQILFVLISIILAVIVSVLIVIIFGLLSFFVEDSAPFYWIYSKLILIAGVLFPIEYFPKVAQPFLKYSPVYAVSYAPAKLFVDFKWSVCFSALVIQTGYILIVYLICKYIYKKGVRKLNVNGG